MEQIGDPRYRHSVSCSGCTAFGCYSYVCANTKTNEEEAPKY